MTGNKLTLADCFKYPESQMVRIHNKYDKTIYRNIIAFIVRHPISDEMEYEITFCKLILRDITALTDEEKRHIHRDYLHDVATDEVNWISFEEVVLFCRTYNIVDFINYLREKNIMIEKPNWFEIGKAVKE